MAKTLEEVGLELIREEDGAHLIVRDIADSACAIRSRSGEALARLLGSERQVRVLDITGSNMSDNSIAHLCLTLRQTDQLEELYLSRVGHCGFQFVLGVVNRCQRLKKLKVEVHDVPTLHALRQKLSNEDYQSWAYTGKKKEGEEEAEEEEEEEDEDEIEEEAQEDPEEDEDEDDEAKERRKLEKLRKIFEENDYDSDVEEEADEGNFHMDANLLMVQKAQKVKEKRIRPPAVIKREGSSKAFSKLLAAFSDAVKRRENLMHVECLGECVPPELQLDLQRAVEEHREDEEQKRRSQEEKGARTAADVMKDLRRELDIPEDGELDEESSNERTRVGIRSYVNRRLFAALGEAIFECVRFKAKGNEAVSTPQGEMAFIAMHVRKLVQAKAGR